MNIVMELALIFGVCLVGVIVASIMPFAVPYSVISLLILMTLLYQRPSSPIRLKKQAAFSSKIWASFCTGRRGHDGIRGDAEKLSAALFGHYACDNAADLFCDGVDCSADAAP